MKRMLSIIFSMFLGTALLSGQDSEYILRELVSAGASMKTLQCDFVQTRTMSMLQESMVSSGRMYCELPGRLKWEYLSPSQFAFVLDGTSVRMVRDGRTLPSDGGRDKMLKELSRFILDSVSGAGLSDSSAFKTSAEVSGKEWIVTMVPLRRDLRRMWKAIMLHFDPTLKTAVKIEMEENSGDKTVVEFSGVRLNSQIASETWN